jgi:hypothetical protein
MQYTVEIQGSEEVVKNLMTIGAALGIDSEWLLDTMAQEAKMALSNNAPRNQGHLAESMDILFSTKGERWIGPGEAGPSSDFPPSHYAQYVEEGGGPINSIPNVEDIMARFGLPLGQAIVFSRYLRDSGRSVRSASHFIQNTANQIESNYVSSIQGMIDRLIT